MRARIHSQDHVTWSYLGCVQFQLGQPHDARASFARAAAVDPAAPFPLLNAAAIDLHLGRYSHAFKNYRMLVDVISTFVEIS